MVLFAAVATFALLEGTEPDPHGQAPRVDGWRFLGPIDLDAEIRDLELQFFDGERLWASRYKEVWVGAPDGTYWRPVGRLPAPEDGAFAAVRHALGSSRAVRMARRARGIESMVVLRSGALLASLPPWIYRSEDGGVTWERTWRLREEPEAKRILRHWTESSGAVWFGEYGHGEGGADSRIWRSDDEGRTFEVAWTFPARGEPGGIRHVHAVQADPVHGRLWIATGDRDAEVHLGWLDELGFHPIGSGDRRFKAVSLMFTPGYVYWGADNPDGPCGIYRWSRHRDEVEQVAEIGGPVLHSTVMADGTLVVSTEIEGLGEQDVQIWISRDGERWTQVLQVPPFRRPDARKWGTASFPLGRPMEHLVFNVDRLGSIRRSALRGRLSR